MAKKEKRINVVRSEWNRGKMPTLALSISVALVDTGRGCPTEATLHNLRGEVRRQIETQLKLEVNSINLVLVQEEE